jgi:5'-nucleotidase
MIVLIDQDGPLAKFEEGFLRIWSAKHPDEVAIPLCERTQFYIKDDYPDSIKTKVSSIYEEPGFIANLDIVDGAKEAVLEMLAADIDVRFCTAPLSNYENCVGEKYIWIEKHFGRELTNRVIFSKDKTLIHGDFLIDDRPTVEGICKPEWKHIIFDAPYNKLQPGKRLHQWQDWRAVI